jgi:hypothetical protein
MNKIIPIILGNTVDLFGVKNDVNIIYNLFYKFYKINDNIWFKPYILINNFVTINYIINIILNKNKIKNLMILIYFSGHSNSKGNLKFYNDYIDNIKLINSIDKVVNIGTQVYYIIDSCFSKNFINNNFKCSNINKIYYLVSCMDNEYSKEIETQYDYNMFKYKTIKKNNKIIVGIFTLYFVKLIEAREITDINNFKNIINDKLWKIISNKYNQTIYYEEFILNNYNE